MLRKKYKNDDSLEVQRYNMGYILIICFIQYRVCIKKEKKKRK